MAKCPSVRTTNHGTQEAKNGGKILKTQNGNENKKLLQTAYATKSKKARKNRTFEKGTHKKGERKKLQEETTRRKKVTKQKWRRKWKSEEEREGKGSLKTKHQKLKTSGKPKEPYKWSINSTSHYLPRGHDVYGTATTH